MAQKTFEQLKTIYLGNPKFTEEGLRLSAKPDGSGIFELEDRIEEYYRQNGIEWFGHRINNESVEFIVTPIGGSQYSVRGTDASVARRDIQRESEIREAARTGQVPPSNPDPPGMEPEDEAEDTIGPTEQADPLEANQRDIERDEASSLDEDLTEQTVLFTRTEDTLYIEVVSGLGVVDASYTISKEDYQGWKADQFANTSVDQFIVKFKTEHPSLYDILYSRIPPTADDAYSFEEYPLKPPPGALSDLPGMASLPPGASNQIAGMTLSMPKPPVNDADVERFMREMREANLLFGEGSVSGLPVAPLETPEDLGYEHFEADPTLGQDGTTSVVKSKAESVEDKRPAAPTKVKPGSQPVIMTDGIARDVAPNVGVGPNTGLLDRPLPEPVPFFDKCSSDKVVTGKNNTWIVFGRDRPAGLSTGYGPGQGHTQAGAIDIVVGRMSPKPISFDSKGRKQHVGPIFTSERFTYENGETLTVMDAARIYISQKTDLDENFSLSLPPKTKPSRAISGIAMKADGIRIISRKSGIRLVTENAESVNSKGGSGANEPLGICLIAANKANELQPLIKGDYLTLLLKEMLNNQAQIAGAITSLKKDMIEVYGAILNHEHVTPTAGVSVKLPALTVKMLEKVMKLVSVDTFSAFSLQQNPEVIEKTYLEDGSKASIKSKYNKVN